jgi:hypothetical protein
MKPKNEQKLQQITESNSKRAEINISWAQNPYAFPRSEQNLHFTEKIQMNVHCQFNIHILIFSNQNVNIV